MRQTERVNSFQRHRELQRGRSEEVEAGEFCLTSSIQYPSEGGVGWERKTRAPLPPPPAQARDALRALLSSPDGFGKTSPDSRLYLLPAVRTVLAKSAVLYQVAPQVLVKLSK